ncbi:MAG TPA: hypothetical protein VK168_15835 [Saprospiraceae bacterium]|nr:hypothetical protein [Saprospiraceae bacterium]
MKHLQKVIFVLIIVLFRYVLPANSQTTLPSRPKMDAFNYANTILQQKGYEAAVDSLTAVGPHYTSDTASMQDKSMYYQALMTFASFAGLHKTAMVNEWYAFPRGVRKPATLEENSRIIPADEYILEHFGEERVIMLNEAHSRGQSRSFLRDLLPKLYQKGFRSIAVEALGYEDTLLNIRKYPIQSTGYYVREPVFGQLIREALTLGFDLVPYEEKDGAYDSNKSYEENQNVREQAQADNIAAYLKQHPETKMIVWAGHGHIEKYTDNKWVKMAQRLCLAVGRDIPSIECTQMKEHWEPECAHEKYQAVWTRYSFKKPVVLLENDTVFVPKKDRRKVDVSVFMPPTDMSAGYPHWMKTSQTSFFSLTLPESPDLSGRILQIYVEKEWNESGVLAVPVMNISIEAKSQKFDLYLQKGRYRAIVSQGDDKKWFDYIFDVQ